MCWERYETRETLTHEEPAVEEPRIEVEEPAREPVVAEEEEHELVTA